MHERYINKEVGVHILTVRAPCTGTLAQRTWIERRNNGMYNFQAPTLTQKGRANKIDKRTLFC